MVLGFKSPGTRIRPHWCSHHGDGPAPQGVGQVKGKSCNSKRCNPESPNPCEAHPGLSITQDVVARTGVIMLAAALYTSGAWSGWLPEGREQNKPHLLQ